MAIFEDEPRKAPAAHVVGQDVSLLSVADLTERIGMLNEEVKRLEDERRKRGATKSAAEALFRR
ncbi:MAG: DUF1192 domain-containing protein [Rhizobiaceae bacterium]|nr:DUF1192 domain-containing protein [Rhizobiaceae bacterium]